MTNLADAPLATPPNAVFMDGKRYPTMVQEPYETDAGKTELRNVLNTLEHIIVANAATGEYIGEFVPKTGSGCNQCKGFVEFLQEKGIDPEQIKILGGDSCPVNMGQYSGAFTLIDEVTSTPRNHFVRTLHLNELPLRHVAQLHLRKTTGPDSFVGEVGNKIRDLKNPQIAKFQPISCPDFQQLP